MPRTRSAGKRSAATTYRTRTSVKPAAPLTMRAAVINRYGGAAEMDVHEVPVPQPAAHEVLIRLDTVGVGSWDAEMRAGDVKTEHGFPLVPGTDGAGVIVDVGARVTRFRRGDRVWSYVFDNRHGGFYAEYAAVPANSVGHVPQGFGLERAGALTVIGLTALQGVDDALKLQRGETLIVHGASGNVGMIAAQFAKWRGARVLATASDADGVEFVRRLGIQNAIDGKKDDVGLAARELAPDGIDAVLAFAGGDALFECIDALKRGGRVAHPNGVEPAPRPRKQIRLKSYDAEASPEKFRQLNRAVVAAKVKVPIAQVFPLEEAAAAHRRVQKGHVLGKIVLTCRT